MSFFAFRIAVFFSLALISFFEFITAISIAINSFDFYESRVNYAMDGAHVSVAFTTKMMYVCAWLMT